MPTLIGISYSLIGLMLCGASIKSSRFLIDGGNFSDPDSGRMEIDVGLEFKFGFLFLVIGNLLQMYDAYINL